MIKKGLIIDEPWIGYIIMGHKTWEMRSTNTAIRGDIALIRKGSGTIVAVAKLDRSNGPFDRKEMLSFSEKHRIPSETINRGEVDKWRYAWELSNVRQLKRPVPYSHPQGAVIWVNLASRICTGRGPRLKDRQAPNGVCFSAGHLACAIAFAANSFCERVLRNSTYRHLLYGPA